MSRIDKSILYILSIQPEAKSTYIRDNLRSFGFWFVEARYWPALRRLECAGLIERRTQPGGPERGYYPAHYFSLKKAP